MAYDREIPASVSSSQAPLFAAEQEALFREVMELLEQDRIRFAVSGAFALHEYTGIWRDTKDLDLFLPAEEAARAIELLRRAKFQTEITDPVWLAKAWRGGFFVDLITGMSNAVVCVDASWIHRAQRTDVLGNSVRVLRPEELIASKVFVTRRERFDAADICHVIYSTRGNLDWKRLLGLLGEHWQMLLWHLVLYHYIYPADAGAVPKDVWQELLERFKVELAHPNQALEFRGSLIDEMMFAIDVLEWGRRDILEEHRRTARLILRSPLEAA